MGALSAEKTYQSQKNIPQNNQRVFEAEVQKQMEEAQERTREAEKTEKSRINNEKKENSENSDLQEKQKRQTKEKETAAKNIIEKGPNGKIKHLDVKV